jgi:hypothetical protein
MAIILLGIWSACLQTAMNRARKREEQRQLEDRRRINIDLRPRFEIKELTRRKDNNGGCDVNVLFIAIKEYKDGKFYYESDATDSNNWISITYKFKNIGKTEISHLDIATDQMRNTALFDVTCISWIKEHHLNYSAFLDKMIKPNETFTLKINFTNDKIIKDARLAIWMQDVYGKYWVQQFYADNGKLRDSREENWEAFKTSTQIDIALECFENPLKW